MVPVLVRNRMNEMAYNGFVLPYFCVRLVCIYLSEWASWVLASLIIVNEYHGHYEGRSRGGAELGYKGCRVKVFVQIANR
jgi:hypothetical protein